jgi:pimeloyl-ACP methyl ester carboxylesterase
MIGQPMSAGGFDTLASYFEDRTVITYDPRGLARSTRKDGRVDNAPTLQATDIHAVIEVLGAGPVEMFASSGGAVTAMVRDAYEAKGSYAGMAAFIAMTSWRGEFTNPFFT